MGALLIHVGKLLMGVGVLSALTVSWWPDAFRTPIAEVYMTFGPEGFGLLAVVALAITPGFFVWLIGTLLIRGRKS